MNLGKFGGHIVCLSFIASEIIFSQGNMFSVSKSFLDKFKTEAAKYWFSYIEAFLGIMLDKRQVVKINSTVSERLTEKFRQLKDTSLEFAKTSQMNGGTLYLQQHTFRALVTQYW